MQLILAKEQLHSATSNYKDIMSLHEMFVSFNKYFCAFDILLGTGMKQAAAEDTECKHI